MLFKFGPLKIGHLDVDHFAWPIIYEAFAQLTVDFQFMLQYCNYGRVFRDLERLEYDLVQNCCGFAEVLEEFCPQEGAGSRNGRKRPNPWTRWSRCLRCEGIFKLEKGSWRPDGAVLVVIVDNDKLDNLEGEFEWDIE
jgi:hypothetical protein